MNRVPTGRLLRCGTRRTRSQRSRRTIRIWRALVPEPCCRRFEAISANPTGSRTCADPRRRRLVPCPTRRSRKKSCQLSSASRCRSCSACSSRSVLPMMRDLVDSPMVASGTGSSISRLDDGPVGLKPAAWSAAHRTPRADRMALPGHSGRPSRAPVALTPVPSGSREPRLKTGIPVSDRPIACNSGNRLFPSVQRCQNRRSRNPRHARRTNDAPDPPRSHPDPRGRRPGSDHPDHLQRRLRPQRCGGRGGPFRPAWWLEHPRSHVRHESRRARRWSGSHHRAEPVGPGLQPLPLRHHDELRRTFAIVVSDGLPDHRWPLRRLVELLQPEHRQQNGTADRSFRSRPTTRPSTFWTSSVRSAS